MKRLTHTLYTYESEEFAAGVPAVENKLVLVRMCLKPTVNRFMTASTLAAQI